MSRFAELSSLRGLMLAGPEQGLCHEYLEEESCSVETALTGAYFEA